MARGPSWIRSILAIPNDNPWKIIGVALVLCLVCSVVVSATAVGLREKQEAEEIYNEARAQGYQASLLVQHRPNVFEQRIAALEGINPQYLAMEAARLRDEVEQPDALDEFLARHEPGSVRPERPISSPGPLSPGATLLDSRAWRAP